MNQITIFFLSSKYLYQKIFLNLHAFFQWLISFHLPGNSLLIDAITFIIFCLKLDGILLC